VTPRTTCTHLSKWTMSSQLRFRNGPARWERASRFVTQWPAWAAVVYAPQRSLCNCTQHAGSKEWWQWSSIWHTRRRTALSTRTHMDSPDAEPYLPAGHAPVHTDVVSPCRGSGFMFPGCSGQQRGHQVLTVVAPYLPGAQTACEREVVHGHDPPASQLETSPRFLNTQLTDAGGQRSHGCVPPLHAKYLKWSPPGRTRQRGMESHSPPSKPCTQTSRRRPQTCQPGTLRGTGRATAVSEQAGPTKPRRALPVHTVVVMPMTEE